MVNNKIQWCLDTDEIKITEDVRIAKINFKEDTFEFPSFKDIHINVLRSIIEQYDTTKRDLNRLKEMEDVEIEYK